MPNTTTGTHSPAVTCSTPFHTCNPNQTRLFAVRPGVPLSDALEAASCTLAAVLRIVSGAAMEHDDEILHGAVFQLEAVKAIVDSADLATPAGKQADGHMRAPTIARFEALLQEAEHLATVETGQAKAFNQGRASAFELTLDALQEVQA